MLAPTPILREISVTLPMRWVAYPKIDRMLHAEVFCVGKWRPTYGRASKPRRLNRTEFAAMQRQIWLNTGKEMRVVALTYAHESEV